ncbi:ATP-binding cassette domain-containing protein, partial [Pseudomonas aeruginosa]
QSIPFFGWYTRDGQTPLNPRHVWLPAIRRHPLPRAKRTTPPQPQGYDTVLGVGGAGLSGGQRQRIALARALYGAPTLVVLDEPNSNLDDSGEQALLAAIQALKARGCTVLLITHRAGVLGCADRLLALNAGQLHLYGERDQVLAALNNQRAASASQQRADYRVAGYGAPQVVAAPRQGGVE